MKCKRETDGRKQDHQTLQYIRQQAVALVSKGKTAREVAEIFGVNLRSVFRWLSDYAEGGQQALLAKPIPGRPRLWTGADMRWLAETLKDKTPQQWRLAFALWTLPLIQAVIRRELGKSLSLSTVRRILWSLGFTPQRPLHRAYQQDGAWVERWRQQDYPEIVREAKARGAVIYFGDEAGMRSDYHAGTTWAASGETPVVRTPGRRFSMSMLSAVSARGDCRFMLHEGSVTAEIFVEFLKRLRQGLSQPVFLIVDNHPIHKAKRVQRYVEAQAGQIKLFFLPPYSPELNPDEQVWGNVKARVAKQYPESQAELKSLLLGALRRLQKLPEIVAAFFRHPECAYTLL